MSHEAGVVFLSALHPHPRPREGSPVMHHLGRDNTQRPCVTWMGAPRADEHEKSTPEGVLVEMQNPHRWIAPRGAAARPEGLEPPTF